MWPINPGRDNSRGGFQNSDVGRTSFDDDYGPEYGVDYARFSDPPDIGKDLRLKKDVEAEISRFENYGETTIIVRNGFVIMKGNVPSESIRKEITEAVRGVHGVTEVINQITFQ